MSQNTKEGRNTLQGTIEYKYYLSECENTKKLFKSKFLTVCTLSERYDVDCFRNSRNKVVAFRQNLVPC